MNIYTHAVSSKKRRAQQKVLEMILPEEKTRWPQKVSLNVHLLVYHAILSKVELSLLERMAGTTRLELATSAVTEQRSNQLNYVPAEGDARGWWAVQGSNLRPPACKAGALTN